MKLKTKLNSVSEVVVLLIAMSKSLGLSWL
jgi:hypothetical protein